VIIRAAGCKLPGIAVRRGGHDALRRTDTELRRRAKGTRCEAAQVTTLRERLLKLAAWFEVSVRRVVVHLPRSFAWRPCWLRLAARVGAAPG